MHVFAEKRFDVPGGQVSEFWIGDRSWWLLEREWQGNRPNVSSVPRGTYKLVPHNGRKYRGTWALDGPSVSPQPSADPLKHRFACVLHSAVFPSSLEGCLAPCRGMTPEGMAIDSPRALDEVLTALSGAEWHLLTLS